ncbi:cytochrome oxidase assembly protein [Ancylostoma duodenale]|uniref:Cytochrome oxidase assembly protein n=1 Tax=Ancylostoma duodenale TaxID=51022 RepID=A0A0C2GCG6_9BILA|nr:cytochrome oxidase assembly protein [Ancylostoma duodenale]
MDSPVCLYSSELRFVELLALAVVFTQHRIRLIKTPIRNFGIDISGINAQQCKRVGYWLFLCAGMCYGAVAIGGLTRLTESGLSMVNWDLFRSMRPPLTQKEWEEEFERYKKYPEYHYKSSSEEMTLSQFKFIWHMEYGHRMWGRLTGVVFLLPCIYFWARGYFPVTMKRRMAIAAAMMLAQIAKIPNFGMLRGLSHGSKALVFITAFMGAIVAGLDAGLVYNSWPKFGETWIPENMLSRSPKWRNFFENDVTTQFIHRNLAYLTLVTITATWIVGCRMGLPRRAKIALHSTMIMAYAQAALGIYALLYYVPVWLGSLHQCGSMTLLSFALWLTNELRRIPK